MVAIDLFQGDASLFIADAQVSGPGDLATLKPPVRHVAIVGSTDSVDLQRLRAVLDSAAQPSTLRRVTFVLASLDLYYAFQDELFRVFPETAEV